MIASMMRNIFTIPPINPSIPPPVAGSSRAVLSTRGIFSCHPFMIVRSWFLMRILFSVEMVASSWIFARISFPRILFAVRLPGCALICSRRSMIYARLGLDVGMSPSITWLATLTSLVAWASHTRITSIVSESSVFVLASRDVLSLTSFCIMRSDSVRSWRSPQLSMRVL